MPFGGALSLAGPAIGIGSSLMGLFGGGGASSVNIPQPYQFGNMGSADVNAYQGIGNLGAYNTFGQYLPQAQSIGQGLINNPYAGQYQHGAGGAGSLYQGAGLNAYGQGGALGGAAGGALSGVGSLLDMGFDPQHALYAQLQQQNQQQNLANNASAGINNTPYGASVTDQANNNFNLAWQNAALGRAAQGAQAAGGLLGSTGSAYGQGNTLQGLGAGQYLQGAGTPYETFQGIGQGQLGTIGQIGGLGQSAATQGNQQITDYLSYLQGGQGAEALGQNAAKLQLAQQGQGFDQSQILGKNLGSSLAGFGSNWSSSPFASYFGPQRGNIGYGQGVGAYGPIPGY